MLQSSLQADVQAPSASNRTLYRAETPLGLDAACHASSPESVFCLFNGYAAEFVDNLAEEFAQANGYAILFTQQLLKCDWFTFRLLFQASPDGFCLNSHVIALHNLTSRRMILGVLLDYPTALSPADLLKQVFANIFFTELIGDLNFFLFYCLSSP